MQFLADREDQHNAIRRFTTNDAQQISVIFDDMNSMYATEYGYQVVAILSGGNCESNHDNNKSNCEVEEGLPSVIVFISRCPNPPIFIGIDYVKVSKLISDNFKDFQKMISSYSTSIVFRSELYKWFHKNPLTHIFLKCILYFFKEHSVILSWEKEDSLNNESVLYEVFYSFLTDVKSPKNAGNWNILETKRKEVVLQSLNTGQRYVVKIRV